MRRVFGWRWLGVLALVGCGHGGGPAGDTADAAIPPADAPPDAAAPCTMTITGAISAAGACLVSVIPSGLEPLPPAKLIAQLLSHTADAIEIDEPGGGLRPPSSPLSDQSSIDLNWMGSIDDGTTTWTLTGFTGASAAARRGSFSLSYDPGVIDQSERFLAAHGTLDATLVSSTAGTVTVHVAFSQSL